MIKVAIVVPSYRPVPAVKGGGVEQLVTNIIIANEEKEYFYISLFTIYDEQLDSFNFNNTKIISIRKKKLTLFFEKLFNRLLKILNIEYVYDSYNNKVKNIVDSNNYDYIIIENNMYMYKKIYNPKCRAKYVFHLHNDIGNREKPIKLCNYIANTAYLTITCSDFLKNKFAHMTKSQNVYTLNNCIDFSNFKYNESDRKIIRKKFLLDDKMITFLYIGRISFDKGIVELLDFFNKYVNNDYYKLLIIGDKDNSDVKTLRQFNYYMSINNNIKYLGKINNSEVYRYISASDCVIIPTIVEEAFGLVALESFACSKTVIATNSGALTELVDEKCGYIYDKNDFNNGLSKIMSEIDMKTLNKKGKEGAKKVRNCNKYNSKYYIDYLFNIIFK